MTIPDVVRRLVVNDEHAESQLACLAASSTADVEVALPTDEQATHDLLRLTVPHEDIGAVTACLSEVRRSAPLIWLLERCAQSLCRRLGALDGPSGFPTLRDCIPGSQQYFPVLVFLAVLPHVRHYHRERGTPEETSWLTLTDLGRHMAVHRRLRGAGGLRLPQWLFHHFTGRLYQLGRLQFGRQRLGDRMAEALTAAGLSSGSNDPTLGVHIPDFCGRMSPAACDASFAHAKAFFARHFTHEHHQLAICGSWLLDDQLPECLPSDSNIVRFQNRFTLAYQGPDDDAGVVRFVCGLDAFKPDELPRRSSLERAISDHLRSGRHWRSGTGWLKL